jgi:hypothetical protein
MKQTAVEWLVERLTETPYIEDFWGHVEQAKEMEKQQIIEAYHKGYSDAIQAEPKQYDPEQYYNETFKSE